ncbi:diguanylate cyclase [Spirochaetia bacterium]|nr:diguanylate cyclase [Spirochaetia bacterium]
MKELFVINAQYNHEANKAILSILNGLSNDEREQDRGSYYKSLSGLVAHILGGTVFLLGMFKDLAAHNDAARKALAPLEAVSVPEGKLSEAQWKQLGADIETADTAYINFTKALTDADLKIPVKLSWYNSNPDSVPAFFLLNNLVAHGTHHRGQVSHILDELKIDNDYSGVNAAFLPN